MKTKVLLFILMILSFGINAQTYLDSIFWVKVESANIHPTKGITLSDNVILNSLFDTFQVRYFDQALPFAKNSELRKIHEIHLTGNIDSLISHLQSVFPTELISYSRFEVPDSNRYVYNPTDYLWQLTLQHPDDYLWHLKKTDCDLAWDITHGSADIKIAVLDLNIDITHPDLATKVDPPYDPFTKLPYGCLMITSEGHGTAVASYAGAETTEQGQVANGQLASAAFKGMIMFYHSNYSRQKFLARALHASNIMGAKIIVSCGGGSLFCDPDPSCDEDLITKEILDNGTAIIMPAGNGYLGTHCQYSTPPYEQHAFYPLNPEYDNRVIVVTGTDKGDYHQHFSGGVEVTQSHFSDVDLCSPGFELMQAKQTNCVGSGWPYYGNGNGTSFAAPIVASIASLVYSVDPCIEPGDLEYILKSTTDPVTDANNYTGLIGTGRINAYNAVINAQTYGQTNDITVNTLWDSERYVKNTVTIHSGSTLTISAKIRFNHNASLIIEPGAKLIVNGGILTNSNGCHGFWPGIEVWGNYALNQYEINGVRNQGYLELNNSTIENANNAIAVWQPDHYSTSGGLVIAHNSIFRNNLRAVEFISYHNTHPVSGKPVDNLSYFNQCIFETNDDYPSSKSFYAFISMWDVEGINIRGCTFKNTSSVTNSSNRGYGIYTKNASYHVSDLCLSLMSPCPSEDITHTTFAGLNSGIKALNSGSYSKSINVYDAIFTNNSFGVNLKGTNNAIVIKSDFDIGPNTNCPNFTGVGINLEDCANYCIEENNFIHTPGGPEGASYIGTRILFHSLDGQNVPITEIYKNSYSGITVGNQAEQRNINSNYTGLSYVCNENEDNVYDFIIKDHGISLYQGSHSFPAGNCFSRNGNNPASDFYNLANMPVYYYFHDPLSCQYPEFRYNLFVSGITPENSCPSHFSGGGTPSFVLSGSQIASYEADFNNLDRIYDSINGIYLSLLDDGNTAALIAQIRQASSIDAEGLYRSLLRISPFLSMEVLKNVIDRNDLFSDSTILNILIANPEELRNEELLNFIKDKLPRISDSTISVLRDISEDTTSKTTYQKEISLYDNRRTSIVHAVIRSIVNDSIYDIVSLQDWLGKLHNQNADMQLVETYMEEGDITMALTLLDSLPQIYHMNDSVLFEFQFYQRLKQLQVNLIEEGKKIFEVDSIQHAELTEIADNSKWIAGIQAQNILEFGFDNSYVYCATSVAPPKIKEVKFNNSNFNDFSRTIRLKVYPNPASELVSFTYTLPTFEGSPYIQISNVQGQLVTAISLTSKSDIVEWKTNCVVNGVYFYRLISGKLMKTGKIVIVH